MNRPTIPSKLLFVLCIAALVAMSGVTFGQMNNPAPYQLVISASLTPAATSAAIQTAEQTFTVNGLQVGDVVNVSGPAPTSLCPPVTARVSASNTLAIGFSVLTAAACTPAAGTYLIHDVK